MRVFRSGLQTDQAAAMREQRAQVAAWVSGRPVSLGDLKQQVATQELRQGGA